MPLLQHTGLSCHLAQDAIMPDIWTGVGSVLQAKAHDSTLAIVLLSSHACDKSLTLAFNILPSEAVQKDP